MDTRLYSESGWWKRSLTKSLKGVSYSMAQCGACDQEIAKRLKAVSVMKCSYQDGGFRVLLLVVPPDRVA